MNSSPTDLPGPGFPWTFFLAVYALSAPLWLLASLYRVQLMPGLPISALMVLSSAAVACVFTWRVRGLTGVSKLLLRAVDLGRIPSPVRYMPMLVLMPGVLAGAYVAMKIAGMPLPDPEFPWLEAPLLFVLFLLAAAGEELAWSGTVLEPLVSRWGALRAALVIGLAGAIWHAIPFAQAGNPATWIAGQCCFTVVFRVAIVWVYYNAGRSVFAAIVTHASYNLAWQLFPNRGSGYDPWVASLVMVVAVMLLPRSLWKWRQS